MFKAVLEQNLPPRFIGRAAIAAFCLHGAALMLVLGASARRAEAPRENRPLKLFHVPFAAPRPAAAAPAGPALAPPVKKADRRRQEEHHRRGDQARPGQAPRPAGTAGERGQDRHHRHGRALRTQPAGSPSGDAPPNATTQPGTSAVLPFGRE